MKLKDKFLPLCGVFLLLAGLAGCKKESYEYPPSEVSLYTIVFEDNTNYRLLRAAINRAGLTDTLLKQGDLTFFAPVNQAFVDANLAASITDTTKIYLTPKNFMADLLRNHIIQGQVEINTNTIATSKELTSFGNQKLLIQKVETKILARDILNKFTEKIESAYYVNGVDILRSNINATNGLLHSVNTLLVPAAGNIYDIVSVNSNLSLLKLAIDRANLASSLNSTVANTLFAPTNAAFAASGTYTTAAQISAADPTVLATFLKYHILTGRKLTPDFDSLPQNTLAASPAYFQVRKGIFVVGARDIVRTDLYTNGIRSNLNNTNILATNGVVHIIPQVLRPSTSRNTLQEIAANPNLTFLAAAITRASQATTGDSVFSNNFTELLSSTSFSKIVTIYAPTNAAFTAAGYPSIASINAADPIVLAKILRYHILISPELVSKTPSDVANITFGRLSSSSFANNDRPFTLYFNSGLQALTITTPPYRVKGNSNAASANITSADILTTNGIVNVIDQVLTP